VQRLKLSLVRICGVRVLFGEVEAMRAEPYSQENEEHERMLLEVGMVAYRVLVLWFFLSG